MNETTTTFFVPAEESIEQLRRILEGQSGKVVSFDDAKEIAAELISFYECVARDRKTPEVENG